MTQALETPSERREALGLRVLRRLADSRALTLFILVLVVAAAMSVIYPNNFPTGANLRAAIPSVEA